MGCQGGPLPKRGRQATFDERDLAIQALREGDRLVIHSAPRLGATEAEIREAAQAVSVRGAVIFDCTAGVEVRFHPDAGRLLQWAKAAAVLAAAERRGKARAGITRRGAPPKALDGPKLTQARKMWEERPGNGMSVAKIAAPLGVSPRTVHREAKARKWKAPQ